MKAITLEQMENLKVLSERITAPSFSVAPFTLSVVNPWSPYASDAIAAVEEMIKAGEDFGMVILAEQEVSGDEHIPDFTKRTIEVYKQFVFPDQESGNISVNLRAWLQEHRLHNSKPAVKLKGTLLDIANEKVPAGTWLVLNHFIITQLKKDSAVADVLLEYNVHEGTVVRFIEYGPDFVTRLFKPFIVEKTFFGSKYYLFEVS